MCDDVDSKKSILVRCQGKTAEDKVLCKLDRQKSNHGATRHRFGQQGAFSILWWTDEVLKGVQAGLLSRDCHRSTVTT